MKKITSVLAIFFILAAVGLAEEASFHHVWVPTQNGKKIKAVLTFSDSSKAIEVHPAKGAAAVIIPYGQIDKCDYQYTNALMGAKNHWLSIEYHDQNAHKVLLLLVDQKEYPHILDALKAHTGIDAEILGNAKKR
jgi:uncharacterized GH25 family protein